MLAERRRVLILDILAEKGSVSVTDLYRRLEVSRETVRRDINRLAAENRLQKTHGGAISIDAVEPAFAERMEVNVEGKRAIGRVAADMVSDGDSLILDYGTTTIFLARSLACHRRLTVYTNDFHIATSLAGRNDNRVFMLGGELQGTDGVTLGRDATAMLGNYYADFAFVGVGAVSSHPWLMDYSREAAELRALMLSVARTPVLLADHTKFGKMAPVRVANLELVTHIVTDRRPETAMAKALGKLQAEILISEANPEDG